MRRKAVRERDGLAIVGTRATKRACRRWLGRLAPSRLSVACLVVTRARLSRCASLVCSLLPPVPRRSDRRPPRGLIASTSRAAARFEFPPSLPFSLSLSLSLSLPLCSSFACLPTRPVASTFFTPLPPLHLLLLRSFRRTRCAAAAAVDFSRALRDREIKG